MTHSSPNSPVGQPRRRLLRVALFVSLAVNLLIGGLVLGAVLGHGGDIPGRPVMLDLSFGPYTRAMAPEDRAALRDAWRDAGPDWREMRAAQRDEFEAFVTALRADPFNPAEIEAIMAQQQDRHGTQRALARNILTKHLADMSAAARAAYADRLEAASRNGGPRPDRARPD